MLICFISYIAKILKLSVSTVAKIISQRFGDVGSLWRSQGLLIYSDQQSLVSFHQMNTSLALLATNNLLISAKIKVLLTLQYNSTARHPQRDLYSLLNYLYGLHWIMEKIRNV